MIFRTIAALVLALLTLAICLSRKVMLAPSPHNGREGSRPSSFDKDRVKAASRPGEAGVAARSNYNVISSNLEEERDAGLGGPDRIRGRGTERQSEGLDAPALRPRPSRADAPRDRVYCMIPFIWNVAIYKAIMETWGKRCDVINFLADAVVGGKYLGSDITEDSGYKPYWEYPPGIFPENVIFINMTRSWHDCPKDNKGVKKVCRHIWEKMWRSWIYVEENHLDQAEWFCKVDYDTFFFPQNLKHFVRQQHDWDPYNEHHYFGHLIQHRKKGRIPMIVGATACWSHKTLHGIADVYRNMPATGAKKERGRCEDRAQDTEEVSTSICLKEHLNVSAFPARDDQLREYISTARYKDMLTWNRTEQGEWWYWKGKPKGAGEMENTIAIRPIGLHRCKTEKDIREYEQHFYGPPNNEVFKRLDAHTKVWVKKVRKAIGTDP